MPSKNLLNASNSVPKVPVDHPDFRYPESRNPYAARIRDISDYALTDHDTEAAPGSWHSRLLSPLPNTAPLHVEIGCNGGHVTLEWARRDPASAYVGLDWKFKQVYLAAEKARKRGIKNVFLLRAHAMRLDRIFGPREIDRLYLYFPDPWPKRSQNNNRLVQPEWLKRVSPLMKPDGIFHIKTDHPEYFDWMLNAFAAVRDTWRIESQTRDLHAGRSPEELARLKIPDVTLFEKVWLREGKKVHEIKAQPFR